MKTGNFIIIVLAGCLIFAGCNNTKHLPAGDKLYTGARVSVSGTSTVREKKVLQEDLGGLTRPKPNSKFQLSALSYPSITYSVKAKRNPFLEK